MASELEGVTVSAAGGVDAERGARRVTVRGRFRGGRPPDGGVARYVAPNPCDRRQSFFGSGLPFPSESIAYDNTPNRGAVTVRPDGGFEVVLAEPGAYSGADGRLVPPCLTLSYRSDGAPVSTTLVVGEPVEHRLLRFHHYDGRADAGFYARPARRVQSQEAILRAGLPDSRYFWRRRQP